MISLSAVVTVIVYLLIAGLVFGLLYWLVCYCEAQFPQIPLFFRIARIALVFFAVLLLIGLLVSMIGGTPLFRNDLHLDH